MFHFRRQLFQNALNYTRPRKRFKLPLQFSDRDAPLVAIKKDDYMAQKNILLLDEEDPEMRLQNSC